MPYVGGPSGQQGSSKVLFLVQRPEGGFYRYLLPKDDALEAKADLDNKAISSLTLPASDTSSKPSFLSMSSQMSNVPASSDAKVAFGTATPSTSSLTASIGHGRGLTYQGKGSKTIFYKSQPMLPHTDDKEPSPVPSKQEITASLATGNQPVQRRHFPFRSQSMGGFKYGRYPGQRLAPAVRAHWVTPPVGGAHPHGFHGYGYAGMGVPQYPPPAALAYNYVQGNCGGSRFSHYFHKSGKAGYPLKQSK